MEEYINRIMSIEDYAKTITKEAYHKRGNMENEIKEEIENYRLLLEQEEKRNQMELYNKAKLSSEKEIKEAEKKLNSVLEMIDKKFEFNKGMWEEEVFHTMIQ